MTSPPVGHLLSRAQTLFQQATEEALQPMALGVAAYAALRALAADGEASGSELARRCGVTPQAMHPVIVRMQARAWVQIEPGQGRRNKVSITPAGLRTHDAAWAKVRQAEAALLADLSEDEVDALVSALKRCLRPRQDDDEATQPAGQEAPLTDDPRSC